MDVTKIIIITATVDAFISLIVAFFYIKFKTYQVEKRKREKAEKHNLDVITAIHRQINEIVLSMRQELDADRVMVLQTVNGRYFLGGLPLLRLVPTNEKTSENVEKFKDKVTEIHVEDWENELTRIKALGDVLTLSANNDYEKLTDSRIALKKRGCNSGVYFLLRKKYYNADIPTSLICIEYIDENPRFTDEQVLTLCGDHIQKIRQLVNQKIDIELDI